MCIVSWHTKLNQQRAIVSSSGMKFKCKQDVCAFIETLPGGWTTKLNDTYEYYGKDTDMDDKPMYNLASPMSLARLQ